MTRPADVLVVVGTDHHPFNRVVEWVDAWAVLHPAAAVMIQHGSATPPQHAAGARLLPHDELTTHMAAAKAVICHGGPATIADARAAGHLPIVTPRNPRLGEHVDEHQQLFAARLHTRGEIILVEDVATLHATLDRALANPDDFVVDTSSSQLELQRAVSAFAAVADTAVVKASGRRRRRWFGART